MRLLSGYSRSISLFALILLVGACSGGEKKGDVLSTGSGELGIRPVFHASLLFRYRGMVIHVDPWSRGADYSKMPKADLILLTHQHGDHLDPTAISKIRTSSTVVVLPPVCADRVKGGVVLSNGQTTEQLGLKIEAVPAYNIVSKRPSGAPFHPKGMGNGYVITFGDRRVYIAGDTEVIPEMKNLGKIDVVFLPVNQPYTMTAKMALDAVRMIRPAVFYPYHFHSSRTDLPELIRKMKSVSGVVLRVRNRSGTGKKDRKEE